MQSARNAVTAAALSGDTAALGKACTELPPLEVFRYDRHRATAFAIALRGDRDGALTELGLGGLADPQRLGIDIAVVELLAGDPERAVAAIRLATTDVAGVHPDAALVLAESARRRPALARGAFAAAVAAGSAGDRLRSGGAVASAARAELFEAARPALVAALLVVAVVALLRLPGLGDEARFAVPTLPSGRADVVVADPVPPALQPGRRSARPAPRRADADTSLAAVVRAGPAPRRAVGTAARPARVATFAGGRSARPRTPSPAPGTAPPATAPPAAAPRPEPAPTERQLAQARPTPTKPGRRRGQRQERREQKHEQRQERKQPQKQEKQRHKPARAAAAPAAAPEAAQPAASVPEPGPPAHAQAKGREHAPGQQKKP